MLLNMRYLMYVLFAKLFISNASSYNYDSTFPNDVKISLDDLWEMGKESYFEEDYPISIKLLEKALVTYRMMKHADIACNKKCANAKISKDLPELDFLRFNDLLVLGNLVAEGNCIKLCIEEHPYGISTQDRPSAKVMEAFQLRQPYDFLQFSYFKTNLIKQACQAVQTYHQANVHDEATLTNLNYYKTLENITDENFKDLEATKFSEHFLAGAKSYSEKNYKEVVTNIENALTEYYAEFEGCELLCFEPYSQTYFHRFYRAVAEQFMEHLKCCSLCPKKLNPVISGQTIENALARCYAYLQFSYYQLGKTDMASTCAASALLLNPSDIDAQNNMKFYAKFREDHGVSSTDALSPRMEAVNFHNHITAIEKMLNDSSIAFDNGSVEEVVEIEPTNTNSEVFENDVLMQLNEKIMQKIQDRLGKI